MALSETIAGLHNGCHKHAMQGSWHHVDVQAMTDMPASCLGAALWYTRDLHACKAASQGCHAMESSTH